MRKRMKKLVSFVLALSMCVTMLPVGNVVALGGTSKEAPAKGVVDSQAGVTKTDGNLTIEKYITPVTGTEIGQDGRQFDVTLKVTGKKNSTTVSAPMDLIIILDESGSMGSTQAGKLKTAANGIIAKVLKGNNSKSNAEKNRVAVVKYSSSASDTGFQTNESWRIDRVSSDGGTNMAAALARAESLVNEAITYNKNNDRQSSLGVIFMTDGLPTVISNGADTSTPAGDPYDGVIVHSGSGHRHSYDWSRSQNAYVVEEDCSTCESRFNATHNAAVSLKSKLSSFESQELGKGQVVTVGLFNKLDDYDDTYLPEELPYATKLLKNISTTGQCLTTTNADDLVKLFEQSFEQLLPAASDVVVTDQLPEGFKVVSGGANTPSLDSNNSFTWNIGTLYEETKTYSFRIEAKDDFFNTASTDIWQTNALAKVTYEADGNRSLEFPYPTVTLPEPKLAIAKQITNGKTKVDVGDTIAYQVTVTNNGGLRTKGITVRDVIDGGRTLILGTADDGAKAPFTLQPGESKTFTYSVEVTEALAEQLRSKGEIVNTATATAPGSQNYKSQDMTASDSETVTLELSYPIRIVKKDATDNSGLTGVRFNIYKGTTVSEETLVETVTTTNGTAISAALKPGTYTVVEVSTPNGYVLDTTPHSVTIARGEAVLNLTNNRQDYPIAIEKLDDAGNPVQGAQFGIYASREDASAGRNALATVTTDMNGKAVTVRKFAVETTYYVKELSVPNGYVLDDTIKTVEIAIGGGNATLQATNQRQSYGVKIVKKDDAGNTVSNVTFGIYASKADAEAGRDPIETLTTGSNGSVTSKLLKPGTYYVKELSVPNGYVLDSSVKTVTIAIGGGTYTLNVTNARVQYPLELTKKDDAGNLLAGVTFGVYTAKDASGNPQNKVAEMTTGVNGVAMSENLNPGTYYIKELSAPAGYEPSTQVIEATIAVGGGKVQLGTVVNQRKAFSVTLTKKDDANAPIAGTVFSIYAAVDQDGKPQGDPVATMTTGTNGVATSTALKPGTYYVQETRVPAGYELDDQVREITIALNNEGNVKFEMGTITNQRTTYPIEVTKRDDVNAPVAGAVFGIYSSAAATGEPLQRITTNAQGIATSTALKPGTYYVRELSAPNGYIADTTTVTTVVIAIGNNGNAKFELARENDRVAYPIQVVKKDDVNAPVAGAVFGIYSSAAATGEPLQRITTNAQGIATSETLDPGTYYVRELSVPNGYIADTETVTPVTIAIGNEGKQVVTVNRVNERQDYQIRITKTNLSGEKLAGAVFAIYDNAQASGTPIETGLTTGTDGVVLSAKSYEPGRTYYVKEIEAPFGYKADETIIRPVTMEIGKIGEVAFQNAMKEYPIKIYKTDSANDEPLAGVTFQLYQKNGLNEYVLVSEAVYETAADGTVATLAVVPGTYYLKEVAGQGGYEVLEDYIPVRVTAEEGEAKGYIAANVTNDRTPYPIEITKTDDAGAIVSGVVFGVYASEADARAEANELARVTTGTDGKARTEALPAGVTYYVKELSVPAGYVKNLTIFPVTVGINQANQVAVQGVRNDRVKYPIEVVKTDETGAAVDGAVFGIYDNAIASGQPIQRIVTNAQGVATSEALNPGTYYVKELSAPNGYIPDLTTITEVTIAIGNNGEAKVSIERENELSAYPIEVVKQDDANAPVAGAVFGIYDNANAEGEAIEEITTNGAGIATSEALKPGTYYVKELSVPNGYILDDETVTEANIVIGNEGNAKFVIERENERVSYPIEVVKRDDANAPVVGAVFGIYDNAAAEGKAVEEITTNAQGIATSTALKPGTYYVKELSAPNGYIADTTTVTTVVIAIGNEGNAKFMVERENERVAYPIQVNKYDETEAPVAGAVFGIYDNAAAEGEALEEIVTDAEGVAVSANTYKPGTYYVKELSAPAGYIPDLTEITEVLIAIGNEGNETVAINRVNERKSYPIQVLKTDAESGAPLAGAVFTISQDDEVLETITTDAQGVAVSGNAYKPGTYVVTETEAPNGYELAEPAEITIELGLEDEIVTVAVVDQRTAYSIRVVKVDAENGNRLAGAEFGLFVNGDLVETLITGANGEAVTENTYLPGTYELVEFTAPEGYDVKLEPIPVTVEVGGGEAVVTVENEATVIDIPEDPTPHGPVDPEPIIDIPEDPTPYGPVVPQTGDANNIWLVSLALVAAAGAMVILIVARRRREREEN